MRKSLVALAAAGILGGCASASSAPTLQSGPDAEVTVDGLYRVDNSVMQLAYMKPGWDLRGYTAMLIDPVTVAYKTDPRGRQRDAGGGTVSGNFALSANQMENFKSLFQEAVVDALSEDGGYRIVDTPGPDVLRITADLIDLIIAVPTAAVAANSTMIGRSAGAVTLVMEIRDSQSGEIIPSGSRLSSISPSVSSAPQGSHRSRSWVLAGTLLIDAGHERPRELKKRRDWRVRAHPRAYEDHKAPKVAIGRLEAVVERHVLVSGAKAGVRLRSTPEPDTLACQERDVPPGRVTLESDTVWEEDRVHPLDTDLRTAHRGWLEVAQPTSKTCRDASHVHEATLHTKLELGADV